MDVEVEVDVEMVEEEDLEVDASSDIAAEAVDVDVDVIELDVVDVDVIDLGVIDVDMVDVDPCDKPGSARRFTCCTVPLTSSTPVNGVSGCDTGGSSTGVDDRAAMDSSATMASRLSLVTSDNPRARLLTATSVNTAIFMSFWDK